MLIILMSIITMLQRAACVNDSSMRAVRRVGMLLVVPSASPRYARARAVRASLANAERLSIPDVEKRPPQADSRHRELSESCLSMFVARIDGQMY